MQQRTKIYNRLQALAHNLGLPKGRMRTAYFQLLLKQAKTDEAGELQRNQMFSLLEYISKQILELEDWLHKKANLDSQVKLLLTQKGVGYLTALCLVNTIGDISRFDKPTKQVPAFIGIEPLGNESAGKSTNKGISRAGSWLARFLLGQSANIVARYDARIQGFSQTISQEKAQRSGENRNCQKSFGQISNHDAR